MELKLFWQDQKEGGLLLGAQKRHNGVQFQQITIEDYPIIKRTRSFPREHSGAILEAKTPAVAGVRSLRFLSS